MPPNGHPPSRPVWSSIVLALACVTLVGCVGDIMQPAGPRSTEPRDVDGDGDIDDDDVIGGDDRPTVCTGTETTLGITPQRRLSNAEYVRTLRDLFPGVAVELPDLPPDTINNGFENDARSLGASDVRVARWEDVAFRYAEAIAATPATLAAFLPCAATATDAATQQACGETLVREFGLRAMRRPLETDEQQRYLALFEQMRTEIDFAAAVELTVMAFLESPQFLYRLELPAEGETDGAVVPVGAYEIASRLSYFLWGSMPDATLFAAAADGSLATEETIAAQAARMLADDRARDQVVDFHRQWLDFDRIEMDEHSRRIEEFTLWNETLRDSIREEQDRFVERTIFEGEGTLSALLLSRETEVNGPLAALYGVEGPADANTWAPATLPEGERAGLLTRAGFLASHSHSGNGSPPLRAVFITERLLCEPRPAPPPDANLAPPEQDPSDAPKTNRQLFEERTAPPSCMGCHVRLNGFGFGLEHYDAIGAFRETERGLPIDASGNVIGTDVDTAYVGGVELSEVLAESEVVQGCATRQWVRYALGRAPEREDACLVERLTDSFAESGGDVRALMTSIVTSPEFRSRAAGASE